MTITKKKDKYYSRFQINGERHHYLCSGATSMKEAEKMENAFKYKLMQQQNGIIPREHKKIKFTEALILFEQYSITNKKSYKADKYMLNIIKDYFKQIVLEDINLKFLEEFKNYLLVDRKLSNATVNRYRALLSKLFNIAIANKLITTNPIKEVVKLRENNFKIRFLTKEEEERLFIVLNKTNSHLTPIIICALQTGMRRGEIFNLKWSNIDFEYGFIELLETKSGKSRKIPISDKLQKVFETLNQNTTYVFTNPETNLPYTDIKKSFKSILKKANIENFRFHDFRHTVATRLATSNIDLIVVKEILGHADIQTTMRYAHAVPKRKLDAIEVLNSYT